MRRKANARETRNKIEIVYNYKLCFCFSLSLRKIEFSLRNIYLCFSFRFFFRFNITYFIAR